jgi:toxin ParE1/3/4
VKRPVYQIQLSAPASHDFMEIMDWSARHFGDTAADRYESLIRQALVEVCEDPFRPGVRPRPELQRDIYTYHLLFSRDQVAGDRVNAPRHFLVYRVVSDSVEVLRIIHDSRDLAQHLPAES